MLNRVTQRVHASDSSCFKPCGLRLNRGRNILHSIDDVEAPVAKLIGVGAAVGAAGKQLW
jgi:hypothetical protein